MPDLSVLLVVIIVAAAGFNACCYLWLGGLGYELRSFRPRDAARQ
jgi:hypothetical protein